MKKIASFLSGFLSGDGGIIGGISEIADKFILTGEEKKRFEMEVKKFAHQKEMELLDKGLQIEKEFNDKIIEMEGTAKDLSGFGWIGKFIILLRGAFRPLVSYAMAVVDFLVFSGKTELPDNEQVVSAFWIINLVIFVFYFGERAIKNVIPVLGMYFGKPIQNQNNTKNTNT